MLREYLQNELLLKYFIVFREVLIFLIFENLSKIKNEKTYSKFYYLA